MTKTKDSPPEEDGSGEVLDDQSGPMWDELVRLLGDEESGRTIHRQLKKAMKSRVIEAALSEDRLTRHVGRTSASVGGGQVESADARLGHHRPATEPAPEGKEKGP